MNLETCIQGYQLENIFPTSYFQDLQLTKVKAGQSVCQQGEDLVALSYFIKGKLKIVRRLFNGKEYILNIQEEPTLIGDIELLTDQTTVSSVVALEDSWLIQLPLLGRKAELLQDPRVLLKLGHGLAQSLYDQNIRASTNLTYTVKERLATHILAVETDNYCRLELAPLADSFGVSYRHLTRVLSELTSQGILEKRKPYYHIKNRQELERWRIED